MSLTGRERVERRLAAILAADVVGYSRLMGEDEEGTLAALKAVRQGVTDPTIEEHHGRIVKTMGDGLLVEFASVVDAVLCAVEIQREMTVRNQGVAADHRIVFRIGINLGDIIIDQDDIFGDGVNVAARLEALAEPGGICISQVVRDQVHGKLDVTFVDQGDRQVKNIARPIRVFRVWLSENAPTKPPDTPALTEVSAQIGSPSGFARSRFRLHPRAILDFPLLSMGVLAAVLASGLSLSIGAKFRFGEQDSNRTSQAHDGQGRTQSGALAATGPSLPQSTMIGDPVFFEKDNVVLSRSANAIVERQAEYLKDHPTITVTVEGYCSEDEGVRAGHSELAQLRANKVRNALKERGVAWTRMRTVSYGETRPAIVGAGEAAQAQNRRAVVTRD
jgi:class 3 adenylate cyclase/outer membrane protein OmpA-like peptidoglycan-associated protein